ncbi:hypothetical protein SAMN05216276_107841 [Streptosporangium subroseum]|uniref:Uncharacterized protein n=1 Tax=Streptosporangium subroseum TaxID=106412 RepID=A0A239P1X3_9ACTN|nr:hypothetical protein [Streptosporangium subroseum]SNT60654.1 hypothetical protein SAMN05216276_107841 [Streptosporangium subroseum]
MNDTRNVLTPTVTPLVKKPAQELPEAPFVAGIGTTGEVHAIPHLYAARALGAGARRESGTVCGARAGVHREPSAFDRAALPRWASVCPPCAWTVAVETRTLDRELQELTPTGEHLAALTRLLDDPLIVRHVCEAVIAGYQSEADARSEACMIAALVHATRHAPVLLQPYECITGDCDHPDGQCPADVACATCSLQGRSFDSEPDGTFLEICTITAPCQVLITLVGHLGLPGCGIGAPGAAHPEAARP